MVFTTFDTTEGQMLKHKRIRQPWHQVQKLESQPQKRWFVLENGVLFYFDSEKTRQKASETVPLSRLAKGFVPLHCVQLITDETLTGRADSIVLQLTHRSDSTGTMTPETMLTPRLAAECLLVYAGSAQEKSRWVNAIRHWQSEHLADVLVNPCWSDEEPEIVVDGESSGGERGSSSSAELSRRQTKLSQGAFILWVRVLKATGLVVPGTDRAANALVKVSHKGIEYRTAKVTRTSDPDWTQDATAFEFLVDRKAMEGVISITAHDWSLVAQTALIGRGEVMLENFWEAFGHPVEKWAELRDEGGLMTKARVCVELTMGLAGAVFGLNDRDAASQLVQAQFGVPITALAEGQMRGNIPRLIAESCQAIRANGMNVEGVFRIGGQMTKIHRGRVFANLDWEYNLIEEDPNVVTGLMKMFLREMPEPLIPSNLYDKIVQLMTMYDTPEEQLPRLKALFQQSEMSAVHWATLSALFHLLHQVTANSAVNMMHSKNLAVVITPNILRKDAHDMTLLNDMPRCQAAVELMIVSCEEIFGASEQS